MPGLGVEFTVGAFWLRPLLLPRVLGFVLLIFETGLREPALRSRVGSPMVIFDAVSSWAEV